MSKRKKRSSAEWREIIERQPLSGLSIAAFCKRESVCEPSFYSWRSRLAAGGVPALVQRSVPELPTFVDLGALLTQDAGAARLDLRLDLGGGMVLHLTRG